MIKGDELVLQAKQEANKIVVGQSAWAKKSGYLNEISYKKMNALRGKIMYHVHFCFKDWQHFDNDLLKLQQLLEEKGLTLDRFGVSIDPSMALPKELRDDDAKHAALYFKDEGDWQHLSSYSISQVHLGDNMIGSPASFSSCLSALKAGVTTMGNISQYFGWDYPEFDDVSKRTESTVKAIAAMAVFKDKGALIHSNLDDGYGKDTKSISELLAMAVLEKYIVCDLLEARLAPSFGDDFHSPYKRLVMLSALKQLYEGDLTGSMIFTNKLGRSTDLSLNDAHLSQCLLFDMVGQIHYKSGHAITVMADSGLNEDVKVEEIVEKLALAKQLESYIPDVLQLIDFNAIDLKASEQLNKGKMIAESILTALSNQIDIKDPYALMLTIKSIGVKKLMNDFSIGDNFEIETDYKTYIK